VEQQSAESIARDRAVFHLRLAGVSVPDCAERLGTTVEEVEASMVRMCCLPPKKSKDR
jgi:hypothetical protein